MLVLALNSGHDGAFTAVKDGRMLFCHEAEKDSFQRHRALTSTSIMNAIEHLGEAPQVIAHAGGWGEGIGYLGANRFEQRPMNILGREGTLVSTTHERAHIMSSIALSPPDDAGLRAALVWEGLIGKLYLVDGEHRVTKEVEVLDTPGSRWALLFALADPSFADSGEVPRDTDAGKLMALAAYGDPADAGPMVTDIVDRVLGLPKSDVFPAAKWRFADSPIYNAGVEADITKAAAALLSDRLFGMFSRAAMDELPPGLPLHISGGCGLNCDWNRMWRDLGHFSSVFVPPCANDSGEAIGAAAEALAVMTGDSYTDWDVYAGLEFEWDQDPDPALWRRVPADDRAIADALARGHVFAWAQGRAELGPRALGNRSLLAGPSDAAMRERLNEIKEREDYRPIAPCCRVEDLDKVFDTDFEDPYMLYFRMVTSDRLAAATHVDGTARCQTVSRSTNPRLHELLGAVAERTGIGALCNTSLNRKGLGFLNKLSDLERYCTRRGVDDMVVHDAWFQRTKPLRRDR
ncbi:MAG TPA: carbamoyltransferase C-terminal domain-containing protein [Solirubrobacterales bacterium]|nr:carbamoyltransferase C-terminal domain-containing protein [Solirubrobacterales bacterium]